MTRFTVKQIASNYVKVGEEYQTVEVKNTFEVTSFDDLQSLIMTLIDFSKNDIKFEVSKEEVDD